MRTIRSTLVRRLPASCSMVEIQEINDLDELAGYRQLWNSWLTSAPRASFFNTYDWLENYWRHFGHHQRLRVLLVRSAGTPIGILPLCLRTEWRGVGSLCVLTYPLDGWGTWYGPIGASPAVTMLAAMQHIRRSRRDWDMIDLPWTAPPSRDGGRVGRSMCAVGLLSQQIADQTTSLVDFSGGWNRYLGCQPQQARHEMHCMLRRVLSRPGVEYIRHRPAPARAGDGDPRWDLVAMCQQVALASRQRTSSTGTTRTQERVPRFLRDAHAIAARRGMVDVNLLLVDGRPAAFTYNYYFHGRLIALRGGCQASPGQSWLGEPDWSTALMLCSIEDSCERGDASLDLGLGDTQFQRQLRTHSEVSYRMIYASPASWRSQAVRFSGLVRRWLGSAKNPVGKAASF